MIDRLICQVRDYAWGDRWAIPELLGIDPTGEPQAELWMGANLGAPSTLESSGQPLHEALLQSPVEMLGETLAATGTDLPFLGKVLAADEPLSIQVHPTRRQAKDGFAREQEAGVPISDPTRTYRDQNHKPEMVVALQSFSALCGFREPQQTVKALDQLKVATLVPLRDRLDSTSLGEVVEWLLRLPMEMVETMVQPFLAVSLDELPLQFSWVPDVAVRYPKDAGVLVGLLLNHVILQPGEGLCLGAGNVHGYLSGLAVEVMANSDNVVRCGLTKKHVDVAELLAIASFAPIDPPVQRPDGPVCRYRSAVDDFSLERIDLSDVEPDEAILDMIVAGPEILLVTTGMVEVMKGNVTALGLNRGQVGFVSASEMNYQLRGNGCLWRITIGSPDQPR